MTTKTTPFKEYKVKVFYHTEESSEFKIMARSPEDANEIAILKFPQTFTEKCVFDRAEVSND